MSLSTTQKTDIEDVRVQGVRVIGRAVAVETVGPDVGEVDVDRASGPWLVDVMSDFGGR